MKTTRPSQQEIDEDRESFGLCKKVGTCAGALKIYGAEKAELKLSGIGSRQSLSTRVGEAQ
jgi:hypothetical protein